MRVLIVDDNLDAADGTAELLRLSLPCEVVVAYDGEQGLRLAAARPFDAVVLDLYMPGLSGIEVAARIREGSVGAPPCLIALTGRPDAAHHLPAIDGQFDRVFAKPLDTDQLIAALARLATEPPSTPQPFNLAELFTRAARQVVPVAMARGLAFSFDYQGPAVVVSGDPVQVHCGMHRLLLGVVDMLESGFVLFSAHVLLGDAGICEVVVDAAGTGRLRSPQEIDAVLARLLLSDTTPTPAGSSAAPPAGVADGPEPDAASADAGSEAGRSDAASEHGGDHAGSPAGGPSGSSDGSDGSDGSGDSGDSTGEGYPWRDWRSAEGTCPNTGAPVSFTSETREGLLLRTVIGYTHATEDAASGSSPLPGTCAWLVDPSEQPTAWLHRRLQRLGWHVTRFGSPAEAQRRLQRGPEAPAGAPSEGGTPFAATSADCTPPALLVVLEGSTLAIDEATALQRALPSTTHCVLAVMAGSRWLTEPGSLPCYDVRVYPFSPKELIEFATIAEPRLAGAGEGPSAAASGLQGRPRVLVVDDNEINRIIGRGLIEALGYEVETANDGLDAIDRCRHSPPQVLLMDLDMPVLTGLEATLRLRDLQRSGKVAPFAIVAATADGSERARLACEAVGMDGYMRKPLSLEVLRAELRRFTAAALLR